MAENVPGTPGFWNRMGGVLSGAGRGFVSGIRDRASQLRNDYFSAEGRDRRFSGDALSDAREVAREARLYAGGPQGVALSLGNAGIQGMFRGGLDAWRNTPYIPAPQTNLPAPSRGTITVGNINTDGSGVPYAINQTTGQVYQNNFPGVTGAYQHQPANNLPSWDGVNLPYAQPPAPNTGGLPGITSPLAGS